MQELILLDGVSLIEIIILFKKRVNIFGDRGFLMKQVLLQKEEIIVVLEEDWQEEDGVF